MDGKWWTPRKPQSRAEKRRGRLAERIRHDITAAQKTATPADMATAAFEPEGISSRSTDITLRTGGSGTVALDICLS
jgi:hypothetical protein